MKAQMFGLASINTEKSILNEKKSFQNLVFVPPPTPLNHNQHFFSQATFNAQQGITSGLNDPVLTEPFTE